MLRCGPWCWVLSLCLGLGLGDGRAYDTECPATPFCGWSGFHCPKSPTAHPFANLAKIKALVLG